MSMFRVFMPKYSSPAEVERVKETNRPFFTRVLLPRDAVYMGCMGIPTLLDALGHMAPKGHPGYAFWVPDESAPTVPTLLSTAEPERPFSFQFTVESTTTPRGFVMVLGMLLGVIQITSPDLATVEKEIIAGGADIFEAHPYRIPEEFKRIVFGHNNVQARQDAILQAALERANASRNPQ